MKARRAGVITGAAVVLLVTAYGANADPADGNGARHDHYWDHHRDGGWRHDHPWDHANGGTTLSTISSGGSAGASSAGPAGAPAPLLAAGIPAFALLGGTVGVRGLMRAFRRRKV
jgi:hypothetical protein